MKKNLLFGMALMLAFSTFSQNNQIKPNGFVKMSDRHFSYGTRIESENQNQRSISSVQTPNQTTTVSESSSPVLDVNFQVISGSMNVFGMLINNQKPLQYNRFVDAVSFINRKSDTYVPSPPSNSNSGTMVALIGKNYGTMWDSTCIWADATNAGRYPNGAIYSPMGNSDVANSYVVGTGPVVSGSWIGSWYASKLIGPAGTTSPGPDQQFFPNGGTFSTTTSPTMTKHDFPSFGFAVTDDGAVRTLASVVNDPNGTSNITYAPRGAFIGKGTFNAGIFVWTPDSLIPPTVLRTDGSKQLWGGRMMMAWNDAGTIGYVVLIGARQGATGANVGWQPIVYKTTNSGNTWALVNGIDFNTPGTFDMTLNALAGVSTNAALGVPFFDMAEGADCTVDKDGKLHIVSTVKSTFSIHQDSLDYTSSFYAGNNYGWMFQKTTWPYVFDFYGDGAGAWGLHTVDSLGSEGPSDQSGGPGFNFNPWANNSQQEPVASGIRLQTSRSIGGEYIVYSWAESDSLLNSSFKKWNEYPNIHMRALRVCDGAISTDEYIVTAVTGSTNPKVKDRAYFHFVSPTCKAGLSTPSSITFTVPVTVTNNDNLDGIASVRTFYSNVAVQFAFPSNAACISGVGVANQGRIEDINLFPNPASDKVNIALKLNGAGPVNIELYNALGQLVSQEQIQGQAGKNELSFNVNKIQPGVYFVKVKSGYAQSTHKLIIE